MSFTGFFSCYLSLNVPHGQTVLKHKHMASKFNPGVKMMKKSQHNDYLLKKLFVAHFFSIIVHCENYQMCIIIENRIAHDLFNYCTLVLCICIQKKLEWIFQSYFKQTMQINSTLISKMELFVTVVNGFNQILIVSYKSIIDLQGPDFFLKIGKRFTYFQTSLT